MLSKLQNIEGIDVGVYKDDGLAVSRLNPQRTEAVKKRLCEIFREEGLRLTIEANKTVVDYLDVTLDLAKDEYRPYIKPNDKPLYVHRQSNHPSSVLKNIPRGVNDRLSRLSSNETVFSSAIPLYQQALIDSGYDFKLKYNPEAGSDSQSKRNRRRTRQIVWFNPPYSMNIETNIGQEFLKLIDNFPQNNILAPVMKRNKVKVSFRTMKNMDQIISSHNIRVQNPERSEDAAPKPHCNCQRARKSECPLPGQCHTDQNGRVESIVYRAKIQREDTVATEF